MYPCDLHTHTTRSDGHLTPVESIKRAGQSGLKVQAITDHDVTLPLYYEEEGKKINLEEFAAENGVELVRGIEISCDTNNEDVHLIGLFCDWDAPEFRTLEEWVRKSRTESYREIVKRLFQSGYQVSWDELLVYAGKEEKPDGILKKELYEYLASKGYVKSWMDGKKLIQSHPELSVDREKPDPVETIHMLHKTGGIVIQAHPFLVKEEPYYRGKSMSRYAYMDMLVEAGLDGIEACYTYDKTSYTGTLSKEEIENLVKKRYANAGVFFSGGSDFHGDFKKGLPNPRELGECGVSYEYYCQYIKKPGSAKKIL